MIPMIPHNLEAVENGGKMNPDDLRERIEEVLKEYNDIVCDYPQLKLIEDTVGKLTVLYPHPDREELERVVQKHFNVSWDQAILTHKKDTECMSATCFFLDDLMAWALGEEKKESIWCSHIWWVKAADKSDWKLSKTEDCFGSLDTVEPYWKMCPICGARRPT